MSEFRFIVHGDVFVVAETPAGSGAAAPGNPDAPHSAAPVPQAMEAGRRSGWRLGPAGTTEGTADTADRKDTEGACAAQSRGGGEDTGARRLSTVDGFSARVAESGIGALRTYDLAWPHIADGTVRAVLIEYRDAGSTARQAVRIDRPAAGDWDGIRLVLPYGPNVLWEFRATIVPFPPRLTVWTDWQRPENAVTTEAERFRQESREPAPSGVWVEIAALMHDVEQIKRALIGLSRDAEGEVKEFQRGIAGLSSRIDAIEARLSGGVGGIGLGLFPGGRIDA